MLAVLVIREWWRAASDMPGDGDVASILRRLVRYCLSSGARHIRRGCGWTVFLALIHRPNHPPRETSMQLVAYLNFPGSARDAMDLYAGALAGKVSQRGMVNCIRPL